MNYKLKRQNIVKLKFNNFVKTLLDYNLDINEGSEIGLIKELILFDTQIQTKALLSMRVYNKIEVNCFGV